MQLQLEGIVCKSEGGLSPDLEFGSAVDILATDDPNFSPDDQQDTQIYEKHDNLLHGMKKKK